MSFRFPNRGAVLACLAWAALPSAGAEAPRAETAAEKVKQALAQKRDLEVADQPLDVAVNQLREQTGLNLVIDQAAVPPLGAGLGVLPGQTSYAHLRITAHFEGRPVREALAKALRPHGLTTVVVGDTVFVTTPEKAVERQLGQAVHVHADSVPLKDLLQQLARETGANVVLDQRLANEGQTRLEAKLDDVPLETAVELLANQAGLKAVRMNNVLYVTTEARAEKLHRPPPPAAAGWQVWPDGTGGFRLTPPAGMVPGGIFGIAGGGLVGNGTGPAVGMMGIGGALGALGIGAAPGGGVAPPVPLTPATKPPPKPKTDTPPAPSKPAVTPATPPAPPPPDKKPDPASAPKPAAPKSGRRPRRYRRSRLV